MSFRKGNIYQVDFWDHCIGSRELQRCSIYGRLIKQDKLSLTVATWELHSNCAETEKDNREITTIAKSTIIFYKRLT